MLVIHLPFFRCLKVREQPCHCRSLSPLSCLKLFRFDPRIEYSTQHSGQGIILTFLREGRYVTCYESGVRHTTFTEPVFLPGTFRTSVREKNYYIFPLLLKLWAILVSIYIYSLSLCQFQLFTTGYLYTLQWVCVIIVSVFGGPGTPYLPISHINSTQNGSPVVENPLVTVQIGTFYFTLMTNIEMIATLHFQMGLLQRGLHCLKTLAWHLRFPY